MTSTAAATTAISRPGIVFTVGRGLLRPTFRLLYGTRRSGHRELPRDGALLLAANHLAGWDTVLIPVATPRPVQFLAKSAFFTKPGLLGGLSRWFFTSIGAVPVLRSAGAEAQAALESGSAILRSGSTFAVFPEGTRSRDGRLYKGKTGAAYMALDTGATVIPVGLIGTDRMRAFGYLRGLGRPEVRFGSPVELADLTALPSGAARRIATERIMDAIADLTGQDRVDAVNASSRDRG